MQENRHEMTIAGARRSGVTLAVLLARQDARVLGWIAIACLQTT
jgi:hypothetical protein